MAPSLVFITSLRHPQNRNGSSMAAVLEQLVFTLRSVCAQRDRRFRVLVVCNTGQQAVFRHPLVDWIEVDLPPPSPQQRADFGMPLLRLDRGCKYINGLIYARRYQPSHVMFFDADDYVSNQLAELVAANPDQDGWYLDRGYLYDSADGTLGQIDNFNMLCGTSHIIKYSLLENKIPDGVKGLGREEIERTIDEYFLLYIIGSHRWVAQYLAENGHPLAPLPYFGAIYHVGHGENHTARSGIIQTRAVKISLDLVQEFSLPLTVGQNKI